jgi:hypothetical protein
MGSATASTTEHTPTTRNSTQQRVPKSQQHDTDGPYPMLFILLFFYGVNGNTRRRFGYLVSFDF